MWNYVFLCLLFLFRLIGGLDREEYEIGVGIADITGPAAEIGMVSAASDVVFGVASSFRKAPRKQRAVLASRKPHPPAPRTRSTSVYLRALPMGGSIVGSCAQSHARRPLS
ncbi:hypothetical protein V5799_024265 [Amblyomma americanum]|uniref:Secreted protein n=1 Tax=Amblyomma americanum TaxID=6943 RepID=A0AAQ4ECZ0_AMBAM